MSQHVTRGIAKCGEAVAYLAGLVALVVVLRHISILMELVTLGPLPVPLRGNAQGLVVYSLFERIGLDSFASGDAVRLAGLVLVGTGALLARRLVHTWGRHTATTVIQATVSLSVLGYSYRFAGLVAVICVIVWQLVRHPAGRIRWVVWAIALGVCFAPYDITCRNLEGPAHLEANIHCATEAAAAEYAANRRVCVGSDAPIYNEPTSVWVW